MLGRPWPTTVPTHTGKAGTGTRPPWHFSARERHQGAPERVLHDWKLGQDLDLIHFEKPLVHLHTLACLQRADVAAC